MKTRVWDLPLRIFHWLLAAGVVAAIITGKMGGPMMDWHARIGAAIMGLLIFRVAWGFIGSQHARFASFFPTPRRLRAYFQGRWQGAGHTPLGAVSVFAMLIILAVQVGTGLFATDGIVFNGPLQGLIAQSWSERLTRGHEISFNLLAMLLGLHAGAIAFYAWARNANLVLPMVTGDKTLAASAPATKIGAWRAVAAAALSYALVVGTFNASTINTASARGKDGQTVQPAVAADW